MNRRQHPAPRLERAEINARRRTLRRRRLAKTLLRLVIWVLVVCAVFVLGLGFGRLISVGGDGDSEMTTITRDRGRITATLPTQTVVRTETVVKTKTVRQRARRTTKTTQN